MASVAADLNSDGNPDLVTVNQYSNDVSVLLGNGDGTFQTPTTYPVGLDPVAVAVGDFNGDNRSDLAVAFGNPAAGMPGGVALLFGNGDGSTFQTPIDLPLSPSINPTGIVAGNFGGGAYPRPGPSRMLQRTPF